MSDYKGSRLSHCGCYFIVLPDSSLCPALLYELFPSIKLIYQFYGFPCSAIDVNWTFDGKIIFEFQTSYYPFNCLEYDAKTFELLRNSVASHLSLPKIFFPTIEDLKSGHYGYKDQSKIKHQIKIYRKGRKTSDIFVDSERVLENYSKTDLSIKGFEYYPDYSYSYSPDGELIAGFDKIINIWTKNGKFIKEISSATTFLWFNNSQIILIIRDDFLQKKMSYTICVYDLIKNTIIKSLKVLSNSSILYLNYLLSQKMSIFALCTSSQSKMTISLINLITGKKIATIDGFVNEKIGVWASGGSALIYEDNKGKINIFDLLEKQKKNIILVQLETFRQMKNKLKAPSQPIKPLTPLRLPHELWDLMFKEFSICMILS